MTSLQSSTEPTFPGLNRMRLTMGMQCNVRCTMCYQTDFSPKFNMDPVVYRERLKEVYPHLRGVKLIGGEPTIMKNCREAAQLLRAYPRIKLNITTNGIFIDDFWIETRDKRDFPLSRVKMISNSNSRLKLIENQEIQSKSFSWRAWRFWRSWR